LKAKLTRRQFLRRSLTSAAGLGLAVGAVESGRKGLDLLELHRTWEAAARPNAWFLASQADRLLRLTLGSSFAPEQWPLERAAQREALTALDHVVNDLDVRQLRLGVRWSRAVDGAGRVDLGAYRPFIDRCLKSGVDVCLNVGPVRTFRWPEEHVPQAVLESLDDVPATGATFGLQTPLAGAALAYLERLLDALREDYGPAAIRGVQIENEPFYPLGRRRWRMSPAYLEAVAGRVDAAFPDAEVLVTSAGRLDLHSVRDLFIRLLGSNPRFAGRLVSGFDYHYKTPLRDSFPVIRYFDQIAYARPFAPSCEENIRDARAIGFRIEVTEGQAEPYEQFSAPGNSAKDFRFLLLRCLDRVLDPRQPALIRIWGVEELAKKMLRGALTDEHRQIIDLIQTVNARPAPAGRRPRNGTDGLRPEGVD
jgi:hypothetical protein